MLNLHFAVCAAIALLLLTLAPLVTTQCPTESGDWLLFNDSCYKFYNESQFWYTAELTCQANSGHLVSIESDYENRLVAKMSLCQDSWIGQYATDLKRLSDATSYAWTDDTKVDVAMMHQRHNFSEIDAVHKPLMRSIELSWYNSLYHEQHPFMCKVRTTAGQQPKCPSTMRFYQGNCYLLSGFEANFIEANFFCQNRSTQLVSVLDEAELRFLNTVDLEVDSCFIEPMWVGLVKLNPCFPDRGGHELCYQWTDYSGKHLNFPRWADGQPAAEGEGREQDCVIIFDDHLSSAECTDRHKFVCKTPVSLLTAGSPVWQALDELPRPIDESKRERVEVASTAATVQSNADREVTPMPESSSTIATATVATDTVVTDTIATVTGATVTTVTGATGTDVKADLDFVAVTTSATKTSNEDKAEAVTAAVPTEVTEILPKTPSSSAPESQQTNTGLGRKRRAAELNSSPTPAKTSNRVAAAAEKGHARTKNEAAEERGGYPWALSQIISNIFAPSKRSEKDAAEGRVKSANVRTEEISQKSPTPLLPTQPPSTTPAVPTPQPMSLKDLENDSLFTRD